MGHQKRVEKSVGGSKKKTYGAIEVKLKVSELENLYVGGERNRETRGEFISHGKKGGECTQSDQKGRLGDQASLNRTGSSERKTWGDQERELGGKGRGNPLRMVLRKRSYGGEGGH